MSFCQPCYLGFRMFYLKKNSGVLLCKETSRRKGKEEREKISCSMCHASYVMQHWQCFKCHLSTVTCHWHQQPPPQTLPLLYHYAQKAVLQRPKISKKIKLQNIIETKQKNATKNIEVCQYWQYSLWADVSNPLGCGVSTHTQTDRQLTDIVTYRLKRSRRPI